MTSRSSRNDRRGKFFGFNTLRVSSSVFEVKILLGLAYLFLDTMGWDTLTLRRSLRKKFRMRWFFDVSKVKESRFFKSDLTDPPQFFYSHLLENTNFSPSIFKTLKKFVLPKRCEKNGQFQIELVCSQSWEMLAVWLAGENYDVMRASKASREIWGWRI